MERRTKPDAFALFSGKTSARRAGLLRATRKASGPGSALKQRARPFFWLRVPGGDAERSGDLGENGDGDLGRRACADIETDRPPDAGHVGVGETGLAQTLKPPCMCVPRTE